MTWLDLGFKRIFLAAMETGCNGARDGRGQGDNGGAAETIQAEMG